MAEEECEETKELGEVTCPNCNTVITIKKKVTWDSPKPRKKVSEKIFAESYQTPLPTE